MMLPMFDIIFPGLSIIMITVCVIELNYELNENRKTHLPHTID
jgi:hypothetical protein